MMERGSLLEVAEGVKLGWRSSVLGRSEQALGRSGMGLRMQREGRECLLVLGWVGGGMWLVQFRLVALVAA